MCYQNEIFSQQLTILYYTLTGLQLVTWYCSSLVLTFNNVLPNYILYYILIV